jgi:hypothetical protein
MTPQEKVDIVKRTRNTVQRIEEILIVASASIDEYCINDGSLGEKTLDRCGKAKAIAATVDTGLNAVDELLEVWEDAVTEADKIPLEESILKAVGVVIGRAAKMEGLVRDLKKAFEEKDGA